MILEGRELERLDQFELCVTEDFEWKMNPVHEFFLLIGVQGADAKDLKTQQLELLVEVAETAGVRGAAAGARNQVPLFRN
jgi:hypothetical protein